MSEEEAKSVLQDIFKDDEKVQLHLRKIRNLSKGYWSEPEAKKYIKGLKK